VHRFTNRFSQSLPAVPSATENELGFVFETGNRKASFFFRIVWNVSAIFHAR
jgi:hypothetical protein